MGKKNKERKDKEEKIEKKEKDKEPKKDKHLLAGRDGEIKRLNRVIGQVEGIQKMLGTGRELNDILAQCKAVHSALRAIETRVLDVYLGYAVDEISNTDKKKTREQKIAELIDLYRPS